jgi:hypothetical protein
LQYGQAARAQQRNENPTNPPSNLALQNLKQVAGSAPEIRAILSKDPGLLVELKRWVAKDATDHGQIIGESELFIARRSSSLSGGTINRTTMNVKDFFGREKSHPSTPSCCD